MLTTSKEETLLHLDNPKVGDQFSEMLSYIMLVVRVTDKFVFYADTSGMEDRYKKRCRENGIIPENIRGEAPEDLRLVRITREQFSKKFRYSTLSTASWVHYHGNKPGVDRWFDQLIDSVNSISNGEPSNY